MNDADAVLSVSLEFESRARRYQGWSRWSDVMIAVAAAASATSWLGAVVPGYVGVAALLLRCISIVLSHHARSQLVSGRVGRRAALLAWGTGEEIGVDFVSEYLALGGEVDEANRRLTSEYWPLTTANPENRVVEAYAQSAFYTARLLHVQARRDLVVGVAAMAAGIVLIADVASSGSSLAVRDLVLGSVAPFLLVEIGARLTIDAVFHWMQGDGAMNIVNRLARAIWAADSLHCDLYDLGRCSGAVVSRGIYSNRRRRTAAEWRDRARVFAERESP